MMEGRDEIREALEDIEFHTSRAKEANQRLKILLMPTRKRTRDELAIFFCRVPEKYDSSALKHYFGVHGQITDFFFHEKYRWGKATFEFPEQQKNCLSQQEFYLDNLGITVQPHSQKRPKV